MSQPVHGNIAIKSDTALAKTPKLNIKCQLYVDKTSLDTFRHFVYIKKANYVYLNLKPDPNSDIALKRANWTVGKNIWIWTFWGQEGAFEFLRWPTEFGIWSLGLLYESTIRQPMTILLKKNVSSGDCSNLKVGERDDDQVIADALKSLAEEMMQLNEESKEMYGPSFFCYKKRIFIDPYELCKHIVCPIEAVRHSCCNFFWNKTISGREMSCREQEMVFDEVWWIIPSIISMILFCYSPVLLTYLLFVFNTKECGRVQMDRAQATRPEHGSEIFDHSRQSANDIILLEGYNHVTLFNSLCMCCPHFSSSTQGRCCTVLARLVRIVIPLLTISIIALQVLVDYNFLNSFVHECVDTGVPMGFRSLLVGFTKSRRNFLPYLGGPYIALVGYLLVTTLMVVLPKSPLQSLTRVVTTGERYQTEYETSSLWIHKRNIGLFGSINLSRCEHTLKLYNLLLGQMFMLINVKFWKHVFCIQLNRLSKQFCCRSYLWCILLPSYFLFCVLEICLTLMLYGIPIFSTGLIVIKACCQPYSRSRRPGCFGVMWLIFVIIAVMYFLFMFFTIFLDATLLLTRLVIFTFTGVIIFPKTAYGYMIFAFTVFYYLWDSFSDYSACYDRLLKSLVRITTTLQRANAETENKVVFSVKGCKGIRETLFEFIIERHQPRRKKIVLTFIRVVTVIGLIWICISLLVKTDNFRELHVIMHVGTALFICALPQIVKRVCARKTTRKTKSRHLKELENSVKIYLGYFAEDSASSDYEVL